MGLHVAEQLFVDALRGAPQREFTQGGQIAGRKKIPQGALGLLGHINLAVAQPLDQVFRRNVDGLDVARIVEDRIRHGLAHADPRDLRNDAVEAFDMLDVERRIDVDSGRDEFFDIHVALGMTAARRIGMGEFIDENERGLARQDRVEVHFLERVAFIADGPARHDLETVEQGLGLGPAMGFDDTRSDVEALAQFGARGLEHRVGFPDAGCGAEKNLQPGRLALLSPCGLKEGIRRRPQVVVHSKPLKLDLRQSVESQVQGENIDFRFADHSDHTAFREVCHEAAHPCPRTSCALWRREAPGNRPLPG